MTCARMCRFPDGHSFGEFPKDSLCSAVLFVGAPRVVLVEGRCVMLEDGAPRPDQLDSPRVCVSMERCLQAVAVPPCPSC